MLVVNSHKLQEFPEATELCVKHCDDEIAHNRVVYPSKLKKLVFTYNLSKGYFKEPRLSFPDTITHLELNTDFPCCKINFPKNLKQLIIPITTDVSTINFPETLKSLVLKNFNQDLSKIKFPPNLIHLNLGDNFDYPLRNGSFPLSLVYLETGNSFKGSLRAVKFPPKLYHLILGDSFDCSLDNVPKTVKHITVGEKFNQRVNFDEPKIHKWTSF